MDSWQWSDVFSKVGVSVTDINSSGGVSNAGLKMISGETGLYHDLSDDACVWIAAMAS